MTPPATKRNSPGFWHGMNDLDNRSFQARLLRFVRSRILSLSKTIHWIADEPRSLKALFSRWDVEHYIRLMRWKDFGFQPGCIYDIGANRGDWSRMCRHLFPDSQLCMFEPLTRFHSCLGQLANMNPGNNQNSRLLPYALGNSNASTEIHLTDNIAASSILKPKDGDMSAQFGTYSKQKETIQVRRLDDVAMEMKLPSPDLVKIDVQGFEMEVLVGGMQILNSAKALIVEVSLAELYQGQPLLPDILEKCRSMDFVLDDLVESCRSWPEGRLWQVDLWMTKRHDDTSL